MSDQAPKQAPQVQLAGLIFDIGDVLFDATPWRRWLAEALRGLGVDITYGQLVSKWESLLADVYAGRAEYWRRFDELLASAHLAAPHRTELTRAARAKGKAVQRERKLFDGVGETLADLHGRGVRLAALSDTESHEPKVRRSLRSLGVERFFDAVIASVDTGWVKPNRRVYAAAAEALGLAPGSCGFVGHDDDELAGARSAGMTAIGYNCDPAAPADVYIDDFRRLKDLVAT